MESIFYHGLQIYMPKFGKGQVVRLKAFPEIKLQVKDVDTINGKYTCISQFEGSYKTEVFEEEFIEAHPDYDLLPPAKHLFVEKYGLDFLTEG